MEKEKPKEKFDWPDFDLLCSTYINNPKPLFDFLRDGQLISFSEAFIACVFFCKHADYDSRVKVVFSLFDSDGGGELDRKEFNKLMTSTIYGLARLAGLPIPTKPRVNEYLSEMLRHIDEDGSGSVEYTELKAFVDNNMEIQDFILRYSGV